MISRIYRAVKNKTFNYKNIRRFLDSQIVSMIDAYYDKKLIGIDLTATVLSIYQDPQKQIGMTNSQPAHYWILEKVFSHISFSEQDLFIDVGCGKGRVFSFLIREKCPCKMYGIELSEVPGKIASRWTKNFDQVHVTLGDAFEMDYSSFTIIFLNRPFLTKTFMQFIELLENQLKQKVTLIYLFDQLDVFLLQKRLGWKLKYREQIFKIHGLQVASCPQWFSIWEYEPKEAVLQG